MGKILGPNSKTINGLSAASALAAADLVPVWQGGATKKADMSALIAYLQTKGMPRVTRLNTLHSNSTTTGTEVTELQQTLEAGTYTFRYTLLLRTSTATAGPFVGVNFTGTGSPRMMWSFPDATAAITAQTFTMDDEGVNTFGYVSGRASATETTTAPNLGTTIGVSAIATDMLCFIDGIIIVTGAGDLELWHSSETAVATTVEIGSSLVVHRTA